MFRSIFSLAILFAVSACGGSSSTQPTTFVPPDNPAPAPVQPPPSNQPSTPAEHGFSAPLFPPVLSNTDCSGLDYIEIISAQSETQHVTGFDETKAIDNNLEDSNRWESNVTPAILTVDLGLRYLVKEIGTSWLDGNLSKYNFDMLLSENGIDFIPVLTNETTFGYTNSFERFDINATVARFVRLESRGDVINSTTSLRELAVFGCPLDADHLPVEPETVELAQYNLDPNVPPGANFDLLTWALDTPRTDPNDGFALRASERDLNNGFEDQEYFFTAEDGGMVFIATIFGATTSANTRFTRSELREMLRRGNTGISTQGVNRNNWILDYQPDPQQPVGGRGGLLQATLKVDKVTITGSNTHVGRLVIGQIHASNDEPIRLYFKKMPNNERGYIYLAHELRGGNDIWKTVLGPPNNNMNNQPIFTSNPVQGIKLNEIFSYEIDQQGARIDVIIRRGDLSGPIIAHQYIDMNLLNSNYDVVEEWNYFKAGVYSQNNTGDSGDANGVGSDYDQATFYYLRNSHDPQ